MLSSTAILTLIAIVLMITILIVVLSGCKTSRERLGLIEPVVRLVSGQKSRAVNVTSVCDLYANVPVSHTEVVLQRNSLLPWTSIPVPEDLRNDNQVRELYPTGSVIELVDLSDPTSIHVEIRDSACLEATRHCAHALKFHRNRFDANSNMFYLRYLVFSNACKNSKCPVYLYTREDNVFISCNSFAKAISKCYDAERKNKGLVYTDKHCNWGKKSDKIYLLNRTAGKYLFGGPSEKEYRGFMSSWMFWAKNITDDSEYPFQTEGFLEYNLAVNGVEVIEIDFGRTEVRDLCGEICTPQSYIECTTSQIFPTCEDVHESCALKIDVL